jgi:hypothetical protein
MRRVRHGIATAALLGLVTTAIHARQAQPEKPAAAAKPTTLVGCLVQAPSGTDEFLLRTPAIAVPAGTQVAVGEPGAAPGGRATTSAGTPSATTAYRISGLTAAELKSHVGHRVELQGELTNNVPPATKSSTAQDPRTGRATTTVKEDWTIAGSLRATTLKMIAASCQ